MCKRLSWSIYTNRLVARRGTPAIICWRLTVQYELNVYFCSHSFRGREQVINESQPGVGSNTAVTYIRGPVLEAQSDEHRVRLRYKLRTAKGEIHFMELLRYEQQEAYKL